MKWYIQPHGNMYRETIWEDNIDYMPVGHRHQSSVLLAAAGARLRGSSYHRSSAMIRYFTAGIVNMILTNHIEHCILL